MIKHRYTPICTCGEGGRNDSQTFSAHPSQQFFLVFLSYKDRQELLHYTTAIRAVLLEQTRDASDVTFSSLAMLKYTIAFLK